LKDNLKNDCIKKAVWVQLKLLLRL
jgi:hypothetical protein